jgi:hypothetical protein
MWLMCKDPRCVLDPHGASATFGKNYKLVQHGQDILHNCKLAMPSYNEEEGPCVRTTGMDFFLLARVAH